MLAKRLRPGDTIGIMSPSWLVTPEGYAPIFDAIERMGYRAKAADNLYAHGWGYAASDKERAADVNQLIYDDEVRLIFFSGGEGAEDVLPYVDFEAAKARPKLWLSYSDGTTLLNAVRGRTGLVTYYGQSPNELAKISQYDMDQFTAHIVRGDARKHTANSVWYSLMPGVASGTLIGGFLDNFIFLSNNGWLDRPEDEKYVLFIEDNICFWGIEHESALIARLELSPVMPRVSGLLFGHFSTPVHEQLLQRLTRLGEKWQIPVAYCDDFGHGENHAILPIGARAVLDTVKNELTYSE